MRAILRVARVALLLPAVACGCGGQAARRTASVAAAHATRPVAISPLSVARAVTGGGHLGALAAVTATPAASAMNGYTISELPPAEMNRQLAAMQAQGVRVVRSDAVWADIEPNPPGPAGPDWRFAPVDAWVAALAAHHLTWEPLIDFSVGWAKSCPGFCPPTNDETYATFARAVAARYGAGGSFWSQHRALPYYPARVFEIWNEENTRTFWSTGANAAQYAKLYEAAHAAIHAADPVASVIVGGLGDDGYGFDPRRDYPGDFVYGMLEADPGLRGHIDGFGLHPYAASATDAAEWVVHFRYVLDQLGERSAPIDVTELGWSTGSGVREGWRASMMLELALTLSHSDCGIGMLAPYDWITPAALDLRSDFGLVPANGVDTRLRPAGREWFRGLELASGKPTLPLCAAAGAVARA